MTDSPEKSRDTGTPELAKRHKIVPRIKGGSGYNYDLHVVDGSESDRLLLNGRITVNEHSTLNSFMILLHRANFLGPKSPSLERRSSSDPAWISNKSAEKMAEVTRVIRLLDSRIGQAKRRVLIDLCIEDKTPPEGDLAASIEALRQALDEA